MSDTPRTDAKSQFFGFNPDEGEEFVPADFARELERENAALLELAELWEEKAKMLIAPHYILDPDLRASRFREVLSFHPVITEYIRAANDSARKEKS
jgi:hypothetical protein